MPIRAFVLLLPMTALWSLTSLPPLYVMICIALSIFLFIKAHSLAIFYQREPKRVTASQTAAWVLGWAGLNPADFFLAEPKSKSAFAFDQAVDMHAIAHAVAKILIGAGLLFFVAPRVKLESPLLAGWIGMAGIVLLLHCGMIHLSAVLWNATGRPVAPIMNSPLLATTVSEFWGKRWNLAFRDYAHVTVFSPLVRKLGGTTAVIAGFVFSGLIHDLAISVPAQGGYGWPSLYFFLQAIGVMVERWLQKSGVSLGGKWTGWCWTLLWVVGPVMFLFHRPFVLNVILPLIDAVDSLTVS